MGEKVIQKWIKECNPNWLSISIISSLYEKYLDGDKEAIFGKMEQLEEGEYFGLCRMFADFFKIAGINDEYLNYKQNENRRMF